MEHDPIPPGLYYRESDNLLMQWERNTLVFKGKRAQKEYGMIWLWGSREVVIGTMFSVDEFLDKVLITGFTFIGEV